ncbi:SDR family oxidoreductase [Niabella drilacis]|uniref:3-oxoacyl-[acyl-carrier protein] reductase n=1 Tax=Niabella drilacis (strain DSM 25811 / CCM 8410 / CCUG 62505 / LMG 26954 / E90) TaxID=1285928 RepID=A0A1G6V6P5_NIADE|nr:SDR family oxidoreductase [Niabella drilacis]SDD49350.1 3-oxoacyl-[acyl-carrier protein] reductase [Niabella drilacis]
MHISLKNKKALVGASSSGLGKAIAWQLAESGATVTLLARHKAILQPLAASLPAPENQQHQYIATDFSDIDAFRKCIDHYFSGNSVDILVNNTSGPSPGTALEKKDADYVTAFNLLFRTVQYTTEKALPHMIASRFGRIINLTSRSVKEPIEALALSNTIRSAVVTWGKTLATQVAKDHITVNNILTGNFETDRIMELYEREAIARNMPPEEYKKQALEAIPMKRLGQPEEMGNLVTFLASEQAAYITGTNIAIDGGLIKGV